MDGSWKKCFLNEMIVNPTWHKAFPISLGSCPGLWGSPGGPGATQTSSQGGTGRCTHSWINSKLTFRSKEIHNRSKYTFFGHKLLFYNVMIWKYCFKAFLLNWMPLVTVSRSMHCIACHPFDNWHAELPKNPFFRNQKQVFKTSIDFLV